MQDTQPTISLTTQEAQELTSWMMFIRDIAQKELQHSGVYGTVNTRFAEIERMCRPENRENIQPSQSQVSFVTALLVLANESGPDNPLQDSTAEVRASIAAKFLFYCQAKDAALCAMIARMEAGQ